MTSTSWLKCLIAAVILMIAVGGITRLTNSGLSMAEWKPLNICPPLTSTDWHEEFNLYKKTPEYRYLNKGMSLDEFKSIYWWEYVHRLLGRGFVLLVVFALLFSQKGDIIRVRKNLLIIFCLGYLQGIVGWWMVQSGLKKNPSVGHFHLSVHFSMAILILTMLLILLWKQEKKSFKEISLKDFCLLALIACTIIYGTGVAGLKAGLVYNTFPLMEEHWIPKEWCYQKPLWINFLMNPATVQWTHRLLASLHYSMQYF